MSDQKSEYQPRDRKFYFQFSPAQKFFYWLVFIAVVAALGFLTRALLIVLTG